MANPPINSDFGSPGVALGNGTVLAPLLPGLFKEKLVNTTKNSVPGSNGPGDAYANIDGFDLVWSQASLQVQMANVQADIVNIENNANLTDTEKMFSMQMAVNTWSALSLVRTNVLKTIADSLKAIVRNLD